MRAWLNGEEFTFTGFTLTPLYNGADLNNYISFGYFKHQGGTNVKNASPIAYAQYLVIGNGDTVNPRATQFALSDNGETPYFRSLGGNGWSNWKQL